MIYLEIPIKTKNKYMYSLKLKRWYWHEFNNELGNTQLFESFGRVCNPQNDEKLYNWVT